MISKRLISSNLIVIGILAIGFFLRFYRISQNLIFNAEMGYDYLAVIEILKGERTYLIGPQTSHSWLALSPLFYWILAILLPIGNYEPVVVAYFMAFIGSAAILFLYFLLNKFINKRTALVGTYLMAISPLWIDGARGSRFNFIAAILFMPFVYFLIKGINDKGKSLFYCGLFLGMTYSFFPTIIVQLPAALVILFIKRKNILPINIIKFIFAVLIINVPFLIFNCINKFSMITNLLLWIPYRTLGFFGIYGGNEVNLDVAQKNVRSLFIFIRESIIVNSNAFGIVIFFLISVFFILKVGTEVKRENNFWLVILILFLTSYIGLFVHGNPPQHYYLSVYPIPLIVFAFFIDYLAKYKIGRLCSILILVAISIINFKYYFSQKWFYKAENKVDVENYFVPFKLQEEIILSIKEDNDSNNIKLARYGHLDFFNRDFSDNYIYLLQLQGINITDKANVTYTIYEGSKYIPDKYDNEVYLNREAGILVSKSK